MSCHVVYSLLRLFRRWQGAIVFISWVVIFPVEAMDSAPLTIHDALATARFVQSLDQMRWTLSDGGERETPLGSSITLSPDGKRYALALTYADFLHNGNVMEVITGELESLEGASRYRTVGAFFTHSFGNCVALTLRNPVRWIDNDTVAFLWSADVDDCVREVISIDVQSGVITRHGDLQHDVQEFAFNGDMLVYIALQREERPSKALLHSGFTVGNRNAYSLLRGHIETLSGAHAGEIQTKALFVQGPDQARRRINIVDPQDVRIAPDASHAIVTGRAPKIPLDWDRYLSTAYRNQFRDARTDPRGQMARFTTQYFVVDLKTNIAQPLWSAPKPLASGNSAKVAWSPNSREIVVGPTYLPTRHASKDGLAGRAVATVNVMNGEAREINLPNELDSGRITGLRWIGNDEVEIQEGYPPAVKRYFFQRSGRAWERVASATTISETAARSPVDLEIRQDVNTPPALYGVDRISRREKLILDPARRLRSVALGSVRIIEWKDSQGQLWKGRLYYPVGFRENVRYPAVIHPRGFAPAEEFSLYGASRFPGIGVSPTIYASQILANRGIAVLHIQDKLPPNVLNTRQESTVQTAALENAAQHLISMGIADPKRIGIAGFSRGGWDVMYALTHSHFEFAAALASDNFDAGYLQALLGGWDLDSGFITVNGGPPYEQGMSAWIQEAPPFNVGRIRSPLRLQKESGGIVGILTAWETITQGRWQQKPIELYVIPDIEKGSHTLQNPLQCLATKDGAVDWFEFWLNGREDPDPRKSAQYHHWRSLRILQNRDRTGSRQQGRGDHAADNQAVESSTNFR